MIISALTGTSILFAHPAASLQEYSASKEGS